MYDSEKLQWWHCFIPPMGIAVGLIVYVAVTSSIPSAWNEPWDDVVPKSFSLQSAIVFWCIGLVGRGKRLHCGGTIDADSAERLGDTGLCILLVLGLILSAIGYGIVNGWLFFLPFIVVLVAASGQIGWGDPFKIVRGRWKNV